MEFWGGGDDLIQIRNNGIALQLGNPLDLRDEAGVEEERLPASHRMSPDQGVLCSDWVPTNGSAGSTRSFGLDFRRMKSREGL